MQGDGSLHNSEVRDVVGPQGVLTETAQPEGEALGLSEYRVVRYAGALLPDSYRSMIFARWMRNLRHGNDYFRLIKPDAYYAAYGRFIERILKDPRCAVRLAVLADDADVCLGFSVCRAKTLDYVYVQKDYRMIGIGKSLVPADIDTITHLTKTGLLLWSNKYSGWHFNPFC